MPNDEKQTVLDYQNCFTSDSGKKVLEDLRRVFKFDMSVVPIGEDAHIDVNRLIRNEGQRSVLIHILSQLAKNTNKPEPKTETVEKTNYIE